MSKTLLNALENATNFTRTENLAVARKTTGSELLNFFSVGGALRSRTEEDIVRLFDAAFAENPKYALKALFYFRDVRGGQGERRTFRSILKYLATSNSNVVGWLKRNLSLIPEFGRWDDLFVLFDTPLENDVLSFIRTQLKIDISAEHPSLLAKWMPSENASSQESKRFAYKIIRAFGLTPRKYRKILAELRETIGVLERKLSANEWDQINYSAVPSQANVLYRKAFRKHDEERYEAFLALVVKGVEKINAGVLYPYDIVRKCVEKDSEKTLDALWKALPDYLEGTQENALVVADVSGSMFMANNGLPLHISVSLAIYAAERNKGVFHNKFITFSAKPELQTVRGTTIVKKVDNLCKAQWDMNTNIEAVFDLILNTAVNHKIPKSEMVKKIYVVSDMEFDRCASTNNNDEERLGNIKATLFNTIRDRFRKAGYEMPLLVFWNVSSRNDQFPMSIDDRGFLNVSGASPSIFTGLIRNEFKDAYGFMIDILNNERYAKIDFREDHRAA